MARPLRLEFPGALYHLTARGNGRNAIFADDEDREVFLACLGEVVARYGWLCYAYCLMDDHYHLLIETPQADLSRGMRQLNGIYTQRFNRRHGVAGHVFRGRFKSIVAERKGYLLELCRYVVLNPVRTGAVETVADYPWSSYPATAGLAPRPAWLAADRVLNRFGNGRAEARRRYADFVAAGGGLASPWSALKGQVLLGSAAFAKTMQGLIGGDVPRDVPRAQRLLARPPLEELFSAAVRADKAKRDKTVRKAHSDYGYSMAAIAREAGLHYATVRRIINLKTTK